MPGLERPGRTSHGPVHLLPTNLNNWPAQYASAGVLLLNCLAAQARRSNCALPRPNSSTVRPLPRSRSRSIQLYGAKFPRQIYFLQLFGFGDFLLSFEAVVLETALWTPTSSLEVLILRRVILEHSIVPVVCVAQADSIWRPLLGSPTAFWKNARNHSPKESDGRPIV